MAPIKQHSTIGQIIDQLAIKNDLKSSHATIKKVAPLWQQWTKQNITESCTLLYYKNSELTVACQSSIGVTQLRHKTSTLLTFLQKNGFNQITKIKAIIDHPKHQLDLNQSAAIRPNSYRPSNNALNAIKQCQKATNSEKLSESLNKLSETLKKL